jgi:hypothetical protein
MTSKCELCESKTAKLIPGNHYVCGNCKKELRLPQEKTMLEWEKKITPDKSWKKRRHYLLKKLIRLDYIITFTSNK